MATTLQIIEGEPAAYPQVTQPVPAADSDLERIAVTAWQRVEAYIAHRWGSRTVQYIVEGPGDWHPRLSPTTIETLEVWCDGAWEAVELDSTPFGGYELNCGTYRFTGTAGSENDPPRVVRSAVFQLIEYLLAVDATPPGERLFKNYTVEKQSSDPLESMHAPGPDQGVVFERHNAQWIPRALQYSGAADVLRPYRRLGAD